MSLLTTSIVPSISPSSLSPALVRRELQTLIDQGAPVLPAGRARRNPLRLVAAYSPSFKLELWGTRFYLTTVRQNPHLRFCIAYLVQAHHRSGRTQIHPRIFYKDGALVWRCASHIAVDELGIWVGKGDVTTRIIDGEEQTRSLESTTDLPLEMQTAVEELSRSVAKVKADRAALVQVLRQAPAARVAAQADDAGWGGWQTGHMLNADYRPRARACTWSPTMRRGRPTSWRAPTCIQRAAS